MRYHVLVVLKLLRKLRFVFFRFFLFSEYVARQIIFFRSSFVIRRSLFFVRRLSFVFCRSSFVVRQLSFIVHRSSFVEKISKLMKNRKIKFRRLDCSKRRDFKTIALLTCYCIYFYYYFVKRSFLAEDRVYKPQKTTKKRLKND